MPQDGPGPVFLSELRRTVSMVPPSVPFARTADASGGGNGEAKASLPGRELIVWNGFSLDKTAQKPWGIAWACRSGRAGSKRWALPPPGKPTMPSWVIMLPRWRWPWRGWPRRRSTDRSISCIPVSLRRPGRWLTAGWFGESASASACSCCASWRSIGST